MSFRVVNNKVEYIVICFESGTYYTRFRCELGQFTGGIGAYLAPAASCHIVVIQNVVPHVPPLFCSFSILIVKHHEQ